VYKATMLYRQPSDPDAFENYYFGTHMTLAAKVPNVARVETARATPNPDGSEAPVYRTAEMWFNDLETLQASLASPDGQAVVADCAVFATGGVDFFVSIVD